MSTATSEWLSLERAACLIYGVPEPTVSHLNRVRYKLAKGVLEGNQAGTQVAARSVAQYLAGRSLKNQHDGLESAIAENKDLPKVYLHGLSDYFAAVLRREKPSNTSRAFDRAVLLGQLCLIVLPIIVIVGAISASTAVPPEQAAVLKFLEDQHRSVKPIEWHSATVGVDGGLTVRFRYRYFTGSGKPIETDRVFRIVDGKVVGMSSWEGE